MKKRVLFLVGGQSEEHEISLISANYILKALDRKEYEPVIVGIARNGTWHYEQEKTFYQGELKANKVKLNTSAPQAAVVPYSSASGKGCLLVNNEQIVVDAVFPVLHGTFGEDGTIQGLCELMGVPYVGSDWGSSWACMNKMVTKVMCQAQGIRTARFVEIRSEDQIAQKKTQIQTLGFPLFVKPNSQGSSVGVSKVSRMGQVAAAVKEALKFDEVCLIEEGIVGREIETAVLGLSRDPQVALPGEIIPNPKIGFYSYDGKYLLEDGAQIVVPAKLTSSEVKLIQSVATKTYQCLRCDGLARVDMFLEEKTGDCVINEVNTMPGFTPISMYPKMWEVSGVSYTELITKLIELAFLRRSERKKSPA